ncbi:MAG: hypothetical protein BIFFINMI_02112 [Phycisphaerae bacterium]|nr:hypothetical protein [Phycisphaerae bacterium]
MAHRLSVLAAVLWVIGVALAGSAVAADAPGPVSVQVHPPASQPDGPWSADGWPTTRPDRKTSVPPRQWGVLWGEIEYGHKVEHCALAADEITTRVGRIVPDHPRLLIRSRPWAGGLSVAQLRERARQEPWAKNFRAPPKGRGRELDTALYYLVTGDESVIGPLVEYVLSARAQDNCGGGMLGPCRVYDWIVNCPSLTDAQKRKMRDHLAATALRCAAAQQSAGVFDMFHHRGSCGWMADTLVTGLVLWGEHADAEKLVRLGAGYFLKNYFRGWQRLGGRWSDYFIGSKMMPLAIACWASAVEQPDVFETIRRDWGDWLQGHMYFLMAARLPSQTWSAPAAGFMHDERQWLSPAADYMLIARGYRNPDAYAFLRWRGVEPKNDILLYDEATDRRPSAFASGPSLAWVWGRDGNGYAQFRRGGWGPDATVVEFKCGDYFWSHDLNCNNNSFYIYHKGHLAIQSGLYSDYYRGEHCEHYYPQTVSSNSMLICQPGEIFWPGRGTIPSHGSQRLPYYGGSTNFTFDEYLSRLDAKRHYEMGEIPAFESAPDRSWSYICGDATDAYNNPKFCDNGKASKNTPKIDRFTRSLVYLPAAGNLVVFDRVSATDPAYRKAWLLHTVGRPEVGGRLIAAEVAGHVETFDGDTAQATWTGGVIPPPDPSDPGRLLVRSLLPAERTIRRIGGEGYEFYVDGKNRPIDHYAECIKPGTPHPIEAGKWRIEISPARPSAFDNFLTLIHIADTKTAAAPPADLVRADDGRMLGLSCGGWVVMFGARGPADGAVRYRAPAGRAEHLVVDLQRGAAYRVEGAAGGVTRLTASAEGVVRFATDRAGPVALTPLPVAGR